MSSKFYWYDGDRDAILTEAWEEILEEEDLTYSACLYDTEDAAYDALEDIARQLDDDSELYGLKLKKSGNRTKGEAADAITDQAGFDQFTD